MRPIRLGLVGYGKIAQDQHVPAIRANPGFELLAVATLGEPCPGVAHFGSLAQMLEHGPALDAVAFCTPPQGRYAQVSQALMAGKHVLVEKPPCATLGEAQALIEQAREQGVSCFFAWHSRFAPGVEAAVDWLAERELYRVTVNWKEDVRKWHPGQQWIWQPAGLGVFDPGINALSILSHLLPDRLFVRTAALRFPLNCQAPIAADLQLTDAHGLAVDAHFDWDHGQQELWQIQIVAEGGTLCLEEGGAILKVEGVERPVAEEGEYSAVYRHFQRLIRNGASDADVQPLRLVADGFLLGGRETVKAFEELP